MSNLAEVRKLFDHDLRDVVAKLRLLADDIESGKYGDVGTLAVAMLADELNVFSWGRESHGPAAHVVLCAGARMLEDPILAHGK